jgi:hypothetical protein
VVGNKGDSSLAVRRYLKRREIEVVIRTTAGQAPNPAFDRAAYPEHTVVERLINRLEQ